MAGKSSKMILAGLAGMAAGLAIGILFAPARGSKTRKRLKKGIREFAGTEGKDLGERIRSLASIFTFNNENTGDEEAGSGEVGRS
jgi:gas vesicle protein